MADRAISEVLGGVLLAAITVVFVTVIAAALFGLGIPEPAPQAAWQLEHEGTQATVVHEGGQSINASALRVEGVACSFNGTVTAGDQCSGPTTGETVRIIWQDGDRSFVLQEWSL